MSCPNAHFDGEGRWDCSVTGDSCIYYIPSKEKCFEDYGEIPEENNKK